MCRVKTLYETPRSDKAGVSLVNNLEGAYGLTGVVMLPRMSYSAPHEEEAEEDEEAAFGSWSMMTRMMGESLTRAVAVPGLLVTTTNEELS